MYLAVYSVLLRAVCRWWCCVYMVGNCYYLIAIALLAIFLYVYLYLIESSRIKSSLVKSTMCEWISMTVRSIKIWVYVLIKQLSILSASRVSVGYSCFICNIVTMTTLFCQVQHAIYIRWWRWWDAHVSSCLILCPPVMSWFWPVGASYCFLSRLFSL